MSLFRRRKSLERERQFDDLPPEQRWAARSWLSKFLARHPNGPSWVYPILKGQARRLALNPPTAAWGRSMRAKKGGYAVQAKYWYRSWRIEYLNACRNLKRKLGRPITPAERSVIFARMFRKYEIEKS